MATHKHNTRTHPPSNVADGQALWKVVAMERHDGSPWQRTQVLIRRQDGRPWSVPHTGCCMDRGTESISIYVSNETLLNVIHLRRALSAGRDPRLRSPDVETYLCSSVGPQGKKQNLGRLTVASAVCCGCCSTDRERQRQRETLHNHIIYRYRCSCTSVVTKV